MKALPSGEDVSEAIGVRHEPNGQRLDDETGIYNRRMTARRPPGHPLDTSPAAFEAQVAVWRAMAPHEKAALVVSLWGAARQLTDAGIAARYPAASDRERFLRRAILELGRELAVEAYPEAALLTP